MARAAAGFLLTIGSLFLNFQAQNLRSQSNMHSPKELNMQQARAIAVTTVHNLNPGANFMIIDQNTMERDFGWVFFYAPRRYLETHNPGDLIPGGGPLVVFRKDGTTLYLSTSVPPLTAVKELEKQWQSGHVK